MYRSVSTSRVSENYYNNNSTSAASSPKVSPSVRALSLEANEIPLYEQTVLLSSEISKKERNTRPKLAENAVHFIPFVLLSCAFILWFFSSPEVDVGMKGSSIAARIEGMSIEAEVDSDGTQSAGTLLPTGSELRGDLNLPIANKEDDNRRVSAVAHQAF